MEAAVLVLEYLKVLVWPSVVVVVVCLFRHQISQKIGQLTQAQWGSSSANFVVETEEVKGTAQSAGKAQAEALTRRLRVERRPRSEVFPAQSEEMLKAQLERRALELSAGGKGRPASRPLHEAVRRVLDVPAFDDARTLATGQSTRLAVLAAYARLEQVATAALTVLRGMGESVEAHDREGSLETVTRYLSSTHGLEARFVSVAGDLTRLRNEVVRRSPSQEDVKADGALNFIDSCDQLARAIASVIVATAWSEPSKGSALSKALENEEKEALPPEARDR